MGVEDNLMASQLLPNAYLMGLANCLMVARYGWVPTNRDGQPDPGISRPEKNPEPGISKTGFRRTRTGSIRPGYCEPGIQISSDRVWTGYRPG